MKALVIALCLLAAAPAAAFKHEASDNGRILNAVACNASAGARTWTASAGSGAGYAVGLIQFHLTRVAATAVSMSCETSISAGNWAALQSCAVSSGVCTSTDASWTKAVSGNKNWTWRLDFLGAGDIRCTFSCTAGGASDLITAYARLSTK